MHQVPGESQGSSTGLLGEALRRLSSGFQSGILSEKRPKRVKVDEVILSCGSLGKALAWRGASEPMRQSQKQHRSHEDTSGPAGFCLLKDHPLC